MNASESAINPVTTKLQKILICSGQKARGLVFDCHWGQNEDFSSAGRKLAPNPLCHSYGTW